MAAPHHPKRDFAVFADCPLENPATTLCIFMRITSGEIVLGRRTVPISRPLTIQGGLVEHEEGLSNVTFVGAEDGQTLVKTPLDIPGGFTGLPWAEGTTTEVTVTPELAAAASAMEVNVPNLLSETGIAMRLPLKAKINSRLLPIDCQVGSMFNPFRLNLTTGTTSPPAPNRPIKGTTGGFENMEEEDGGILVTLPESSFVDNAFSVPAATGCGSLFTSLLDFSLGIPSPGGRNAAVLTGSIELATTANVKASE